MTKISLLPPDTGPSTDDLIATVDITSGLTKKITIASLITTIFSNLFSQRQAWVTPTLASGWSNWDVGGPGFYGYPQYYKDQMGIVHLRGLVKNSSGGTLSGGSAVTIFTLPAGYRPTQLVLTGTMGNDVIQRIDVQDTGAVKLTGTGNIPNNSWLALNNIHFLAEQ